METSQVYDIKLTEIQVDKYNVRKHERDLNINDLAESIKRYGQMQPVVLMGKYGKPPYNLIVGQRRFLAHKKLKKTELKATFIDKLNETDALVYSLAENLQRADLNFTDKSDTLTRLYNLLGKSVKTVANKLGISQPTVLEYVKINDFLDEETKRIVKKTKINKSELKRAIKISKGDKSVLKKNLGQFKELTAFEQKRAMAHSQTDPESSFAESVKFGKKANIEETVIVRLSKETNAALVKASKHIHLDKDELAKKAIEEWLRTNGFLND
jgi:ParB family transcriptional regulator, chromosome partitioning protein